MKGMLGTGCALIATPVFASIPIRTLAVVVLAIPAWMINVFQVGQDRHRPRINREEWVLMVLAILGALLGVVALGTYSAGPIVPFVIALVILGYALFEIFGGFLTVEEAHHPVALGTAGALEGFLLAVSNLGPLLPAYFHTFERDTERYIGGLSMVLGAIFTVGIVVILLDGLVRRPTALARLCHRGRRRRRPLFAGTYLRRLGGRRDQVQLVRGRAARRRDRARRPPQDRPGALPLKEGRR